MRILLLLLGALSARTIDMRAYLGKAAASGPIKFAFGSCFDGRDPDTGIFRSILDYAPHVFLWLGDFAYTDIRIVPGYFRPGSPDYRRQRFLDTQNQKYYSKFRQTRLILGIMDDHDYGLNDAGASNPVKQQNKAIFLEMLNQPPDSPRWDLDRGLQESYELRFGDFMLQIILLDTRFYNEMGATFLGEAQWRWLEQLIAESKADLIILGSPVQILQNIPSLPKEAWPIHEKRRLLQLLQRYRKPGVIMISGDIHFHQAYRTPCPLGGSGYYLHELTSSGLSHHASQRLPNADQFIQAISPKTFWESPLASELNYGVVEVDRDRQEVRLQARGRQSEVRWERVLRFEDLSYARGKAERHIFDCRMANLSNNIIHDLMTMLAELANRNEASLLMLGLFACTLAFFTTFVIYLPYRCFFWALRRRLGGGGGF